VDDFLLERAFAYEQLRRWTLKYEEDYAKHPQMADTYLARALVIQRAGDARFATPEEIQAALVLYHIVSIEDTIETGEAEELLDGIPILKHLADGLSRHLNVLSQITGKKIPTAETATTFPATVESTDSDEFLKNGNSNLKLFWL